MTTCSWMECDNLPDPRVADDRCLWHSEDPKKPHDPFEEEFASFFDVADAYIEGWCIPIKAHFAGTRTERKVWTDIEVSAATFLEAVNFAWIQPVVMELSDTTFESAVSFASSDFAHSEHLRFERVTFEGVTVFDQVVFDDMVFFDCRFKGSTTFKNAKARLLRFGSCHFEGDTQFEQFSTSDSTTFLECVFAGPTTFADTDMSRIHFTRCQVMELRLSSAAFLSNADFHAIEWPRDGLAEERDARRVGMRYPRHRYPSGIPDAEDIKRRLQREMQGAKPYECFDKPTLQDAERVYRELRRAADSHRYWHDASYLYKRELEMRRLAAGPAPGLRDALRRNIGSVEGWFALLSDYGTSLQRPLAWLGLLLLVVYPTVFAALGVTENGVVYRLEFLPNLPEWVKAHLSLVALSISMAALVPAPSTTVLSPLAELASISLRIVGPLLAFLVTLAIRTRVRR